MIGLIIGFAGALYYAWIIEPVSYIAASPARLSDEFKEEYILLVSQSFAADGNWEEAQRRFAELDDPEIANTVTEQLERYLRRGEPVRIMQNMAVVAERLGSRSSAVAVFVPVDVGPSIVTRTQQSALPTSTLLPTPTSTIRSTRTVPLTPTPPEKPSQTPIPVYRLLKQEKICRRNNPLPIIEVVVYDAFLEPIPGVEILVNWDGGTDHFFTGYHPDKGPGYGDFTMEPEISYTVELADGSSTAKGVQIENCGTVMGGLAGGWRLTFQNTDVQQESTEP
jgi:hypothetical protein